MRYNLLGEGSHWFPGGQVKEIDPEALRTALKNSPFADQIPKLLQETHALLSGVAVKRLSQQ
jgi:predicted aldo/keto reductase-like oxidoreductase